ncbi:MAG: hypothetical protein H0X37_17340 [Herpetosiphonaceae bacterium]|nr:hypothetical protein [Herpetosiphonaceae bacterium]
MSRIVEIDEHGVLQLPDDLLATVKPRTRYMVEIQGATLIFHPDREQPFGTETSGVARSEALRRWAALEHPPVPMLTDEALSREQMYD